MKIFKLVPIVRKALPISLLNEEHRVGDNTICVGGDKALTCFCPSSRQQHQLSSRDMMNMRIAKSGLTLFGLMFFNAPGLAHHSGAVHFDPSSPIEIVGVLTEVKWRNPHVQLQVTTRDENGEETVWRVEEVGVNEQIRRGVTKDRYQLGEEVRVFGPRGRNNVNAILATNTLLVSSGIELTAPGRQPRWSDEVIMTRQQYQATMTEGSSATAMGLFRVWSRILGVGRRSLWKDSYPLTEQARATQDNWDRVNDNPFIFCQNAMPAIMDTGYPIEIRQDGDDILIRAEEQDLTRIVHMTGNAAKVPPGPLGHSVGRWDGDTLAVKTTEIDFPWFDQTGIPQSVALTLEERYSVSEDERHLNLVMTATDPENFTEPVVLTRQWVWVPDVEIQRFDCSYERSDL